MSSKKRSTKEILKQNLDRSAPDRMQKLIVFMHDIRSLHNVGAVFRNTDAFGINKLILSGVTPTPPRPEITKTAIGAEKHVNWQTTYEPVNMLEELQKTHAIIGIEQTDTSLLLPDFEIPDRPLCLVFGNEVTGIDELLLPLIDSFVEIPQYGHKHSLNVSVATGVVLYGFLEKYWGFI
jgi:tRNA G18 (ribose-2'-O)-methylase SpoU